MTATFSTSDLIAHIRRRQEEHPELKRWLTGGIPFYCFDHLSALGVCIRRRPEVKVKIAELISLDRLIGTWTHEEALEMDHALRDLSRIDRAMWE